MLNRYSYSYTSAQIKAWFFSSLLVPVFAWFVTDDYLTTTQTTELRYALIACMWAGCLAIIGWKLFIPSLREGIDLCVTEGNDAIKKIRSTFLTQEWIDSQLVGLAQAFASASTEVISLQGTDAEAMLKLASERVKSASQAFWDAHKLATDLGFQVDSKLEDYAERPTVLKVNTKPAKKVARRRAD